MNKKELQAALTAKGLKATGTVKELEARLNSIEQVDAPTFKSNYSVDKVAFENPIMGGSVLKDTDDFDVVTIDGVKDTSNTSTSGYRAFSLDADGKKIVRYLNQGEVLELAKQINAYAFDDATKKYKIDTDRLILSIKNKEVFLAA